MISTKPRTDAPRVCAKHPERTATSLRITRQAQRGTLPAQTIIRPECRECAGRAPKGPERVVSVKP